MPSPYRYPQKVLQRRCELRCLHTVWLRCMTLTQPVSVQQIWFIRLEIPVLRLSFSFNALHSSLQYPQHYDRDQLWVDSDLRIWVESSSLQSVRLVLVHPFHFYGPCIGSELARVLENCLLLMLLRVSTQWERENRLLRYTWQVDHCLTIVVVVPSLTVDQTARTGNPPPFCVLILPPKRSFFRYFSPWGIFFLEIIFCVSFD